MAVRVALVTCADLPDLDADDRLLVRPLEGLGCEVSTPVWDDPAVDWPAFDLVVIRDTWDYPDRRAEFVAWARSVARLANPAGVVEWNTDKRYLSDLAAVGVPVVPTTWLAPGDSVSLPAMGRHVVKPAVGAGSIDAAAYALHDAHEMDLARDHAARLLAADRTVMLQPYITAVEKHGESGLIFLGGEFSHAIVKGAMLAGKHESEADGLYMSESVGAREPSSAEMDVAKAALAAVPGGSRQLAYARVDLVPDQGARPMLIELELTEPSLFLGTAPGAAERFAGLIAKLALTHSGK